MSNRTFITGILFLFLSGCAATSSTSDMPSELKLEYRFPADSHLAYNFSTSSKEISEVMGQSIEVFTVSSTGFSILPKGLEGGNNNLQITIDTSYMNITHPRGELKADMADVMGKSFTMQVSRYGKETNLKGNEEIQYTLGPAGKRNATTGFSAIFTDLSAKPVKIGDTWPTRDSIHEGSGGMNVFLVFDGLSRVDAMEERAGYHCARIVSTYKGTIKGSGAQGPMQLSTTGTLEGTDTSFFAYKEGLLLESTSEVTVKTTTEASGPQDLTIPGTRTSTMKLNFEGRDGMK